MKKASSKDKPWAVPILIAIGAGVALAAWHNHRKGELSPIISRVYFSDDEGKSYFADDVDKPFPFDHNGKQAYRAYVYSLGESGKPFVGLLGRQVQPKKSPVANGDPRFKSDPRSAPIEVKKPGDTKWVPFTGPEGQKLLRSLSPDGDMEAVFPD